MRTIVALLILLVSTPCFAGSYDGYIEYWYDYPPGSGLAGGSGMKYFHKGDYVELRSPYGSNLTYNVQKLGSQLLDQRIAVHICVNEQCNSEFWRRRLPINYTTRRTP